MALDQLRAARALLSPEGAWLPGYSFGAVDAGGHSCRTRAPEAVRFGVLSALVRLRGDIDERLRAEGLLCRAVEAKYLHAWEQEPGRTQDEVLDAIDRAITLEIDGGPP